MTFSIPSGVQTVLPGDNPTYPMAYGNEVVRSVYNYGLDSVGQYDDIQTLEIIHYFPARLTQGQLQQMVQGMINQASGQGSVVAHAVFEDVKYDVYVPQSFCVLDSSHCFTVPDQICIPWTNWCVDTRQHLDIAYQYRIWMCITNTAGVAAFRAAIPLLGWFLISVLVAVGVVAILGIAGMMQGRLTYAQFVQGIKDILRTPGENAAEAEAGLAWPLVAMAVAMVTASVAIPYLTTSGKLGAMVPIPGVPGGNVSGGVELGQQGKRR